LKEKLLALKEIANGSKKYGFPITINPQGFDDLED